MQPSRQPSMHSAVHFDEHNSPSVAVSRVLSLAAVNFATAWTPFAVTAMQPFAPHTAATKGEPFVPKQAWRGAVGGVKALRRLKEAEKQGTPLKSELLVVTGHDMGHLMVWHAENLETTSAAAHYNNVTVSECLVLPDCVLTRVERHESSGKATDDTDVYVWDLDTMKLRTTLAGHDEHVQCFAADADVAHRVITGAADKAICLWDLRTPAEPVARLTGHTGGVGHVLVSNGVVVSGSSDGTVRLWNLKDRALLGTGDNHNGPVSVLRWHTSYKEAVRARNAEPAARSTGTRRSSLFADSEHKESQPPAAGVVLSGCSGGSIVCWHVTDHALVPMWNHKPFRSLVTDIVWDGSLVVSSSLAEGFLNFFHTEQKVGSRVLVNADSGVRQLVVDRRNKVLAVGGDNGQIGFVGYEGLQENPRDADIAQLYSVLRPHTGSITRMLLELSEHGGWERLVSVSLDNSIVVMDFDAGRDSAKFHGHGSREMAAITKNGTVATVSNDTVLLWDPVAMTKKNIPRRCFEGHTQRINALRYSGDYQKFITGGEDGFFRTWDVSFFEEGVDPRDELVEPCEAFDMHMPVRCLGAPQGALIPLGGQRGRTGSVTVFDFVEGRTLFHPVGTDVFPVALELMCESGVDASGSEARYYLLAQLRTGEVLLFHGQVNPATMQPLRTVLPEQIEYSLEYEASLPYPLPVMATLNEKYTPPRIEMLHVPDERMVKLVELLAPPNRADVVMTPKFSCTIPGGINTVEPVRQAGISAAVAADNSSTYLLGATGHILLEVRYDAAVLSFEAEGISSMRGRTSLARMPTPGQEAPRHPACCAITFVPDSRCMVLGYRDGLAQVFDMVNKRVCRRVAAHGTAISRALLVPAPINRLVTACVTGDLRFDTLFSRNIREAPEEASLNIDATSRRLSTVTPPPVV